MLLSSLRRPILFVGGKGGVGKTTVAAAIALAGSEAGRTVLLVSTDPAHSVADVLDARVTAAPSEVRPGFWACELDPAREADRYIAEVKARVAEATSPRIMREVARQIDIARASPGAEEAALFERFTRIIEECGEAYDQIIFDTAPTGHTLRLLALPEQMGAWMHGLIGRRRKVNVLQRMWRNVGGGEPDNGGESDPVLSALEARRARFERARQVLTEADRTGFVFVLTPERLPILETERAAATLTKHGIPVAAILANRVLPANADGRFLRDRRRREATYLEQIERSFSDYDVRRVPLLETDVVGVAMLRRIAGALSSDVG